MAPHIICVWKCSYDVKKKKESACKIAQFYDTCTPANFCLTAMCMLVNKTHFKSEGSCSLSPVCILFVYQLDPLCSIQETSLLGGEVETMLI